MIKIGFIGTGNMGGALARAAAKSDSAEIYLYDTDSAKVDSLSAELGATVLSDKDVCDKADYIFIGVKPQIIAQVIKGLAPILKKRGDEVTLVSMAAGVSTEKIENMLGFSNPIIRIMPNLPVSNGNGMIVYTLNNSVSPAKAEKLIKAMSNAGVWDEIDEELIDAASALSGCGPAFVFMFIDALSKATENCGLPAQKALKYAAQTALGAAAMLGESDLSPTELIGAVCSPGGSTIEGVRHFKECDLYGTVNAAVNKSFKRTKELGK